MPPPPPPVERLLDTTLLITFTVPQEWLKIPPPLAAVRLSVTTLSITVRVSPVHVRLDVKMPPPPKRPAIFPETIVLII